jgi:hypothetical protein
MNKKQVFQDLLIGTLDTKFALYDPVEVIDFIVACLDTSPRNVSKIITLLQMPPPETLQSMYKPCYNRLQFHLLRNLSKIYKLKMFVVIDIAGDVYRYNLQDIGLLHLLNDIISFVKIYRYRHYANCTSNVMKLKIFVRNLSQKTSDDLSLIKRHYGITLKFLNILKTEFNIGSYLHIESTTPLYENEVLNEILNISL